MKHKWKKPGQTDKRIGKVESKCPTIAFKSEEAI